MSIFEKRRFTERAILYVQLFADRRSHYPDDMLGHAIYAQDNGTITLAGLDYRQSHWQVGFRSHGEYSAPKSTLVSGLAHTHSERDFSYHMTVNRWSRKP